MSKKMNWARASKDTKPKVSVKDEEEIIDGDRASRWLAKIEEQEARKAQNRRQK